MMTGVICELLEPTSLSQLLTISMEWLCKYKNLVILC